MSRKAGFSRHRSGGLLPLLLISILGQTDPLAAGERLFSFEASHMGTLFTLRLYADHEEAAQAAARKAFAKVASLEAIFSDYDATSEVMRLVDAPHGEPVKVSSPLFHTSRLALELSEKTKGAFDITMGPQVRNWRLARRTGKLPTNAERATAEAASGFWKLKLDPESQSLTLTVPGMRLDYGGLAKGVAADAALKVLRAAGFPRAVVAASGDIALGTPPPDQPEGWEIGIEHLKGRPQTFRLKDCGISTSGDTAQWIEIDGRRYSHIVDPRTGLGLENGLIATVIAPSATLSDPLATAACVLGVHARNLPVYKEPNTRLILTLPTAGAKPEP